jgi:hypothetical protein
MLPGSYDPAPENPRNERDAIEEAEAGGHVPPSVDEQPEVNDETLSEVFQQPIKAAGDLSEVADASSGITTKDVARDLETAAKSGVPTERELLQQILRRLGRIEEQLEKGESQVPPSRERRSLEDMFSELIDVLRRMERSSDEISDLRKRMGRIEEVVANVRTDRRTSGQSSDPPRVVYGPTPRPQLPEPEGQMPVKAKDGPGQSSEPETESSDRSVAGTSHVITNVVDHES